MACVSAWYAVHVKMWFDIMKSTYRFLTLFYINSLSDFFFTFFFFCCFLSIFLHPTKTLCRQRLYLILACVSSYRWVHFSRAVLFCHPHQQLLTHYFPNEADEEGIAGEGKRNKREYTLTRQSEGEEVGIAGKGTGNKRNEHLHGKEKLKKRE